MPASALGRPPCGGALNPACPADLLRALHEDAVWAVRAAVAASPRAPEHLLLRLAEDGVMPVRLALAGNPSATPRVVAALLASPDELVRGKALGHPAAPPDALVSGAQGLGASRWVLRRIADNPACPDPLSHEIRTWLAGGTDGGSGGDATFDPDDGASPIVVVAAGLLALGVAMIHANRAPGPDPSVTGPPEPVGGGLSGPPVSVLATESRPGDDVTTRPLPGGGELRHGSSGTGLDRQDVVEIAAGPRALLVSRVTARPDIGALGADEWLGDREQVIEAGMVLRFSTDQSLSEITVTSHVEGEPHELTDLAIAARPRVTQPM